MLTRVGTFSITLIIDRSRTPGSLQPLGSFLFTGVAVKELTFLKLINNSSSDKPIACPHLGHMDAP